MTGLLTLPMPIVGTAAPRPPRGGTGFTAVI
jgi:hypothetical protein